MKKAIICEAPGAIPTRDRIERPGLTVVAIGHLRDLPSVAAALARSGVTLIELCGGISPRWRPIVSAAAGPGVRVGSVTFGIESLVAAAGFNQAYTAGTPPGEAFIFLETGSNSQRDRFTRSFPPQEMAFVPVPDEAAAAPVARALMAEGIGLIELYGGFSSAGVAGVIDAVAGEIPVGSVSFVLDATYPDQRTAAR